MMFKNTLAILAGAALMLLCGQAFADPQCVTNYGKTVCGYHCVANYGDVQCAQTPQGACMANYGQVVCWDPPRYVDEKAMCKADYGKIACGYHCVSSYGDVVCARTPNGICKATNGQIVCFD